MWRSVVLSFIATGLIGLPCTASRADTTNEHLPKVAAPSARKVGVEEFEKLWKAKTNVVLDVRSRKEFDAGHIPGAKNLDVNQSDFQQKASSLDKEKVYLVHCAAGVRSARACDKLRQLGFQHLIDLAPGFKEWQKAGKEVEK